MNKAIKYRLYPNEEQKQKFAQTFGCCRKVWNLMLADKIAYYLFHLRNLFMNNIRDIFIIINRIR